MGRTWVRVGVVLLVAGLSSAAARASGENPSARAASYVVRPGDTLWSISRSLVGPAGDPRRGVEAIREANSLGGGALVPGSTLVLPATS